MKTVRVWIPIQGDECESIKYEDATYDMSQSPGSVVVLDKNKKAVAHYRIEAIIGIDCIEEEE